MISLPADWAKQQGLKKGDELEIELRNGSLIVLPRQHRIGLDLPVYLKLTEKELANLRKIADKLEIVCDCCKSAVEEKKTMIEGVRSSALVCSGCGRIALTERHQKELEMHKMLDGAKQLRPLAEGSALVLPLKAAKAVVEVLDEKSFLVKL